MTCRIDPINIDLQILTTHSVRQHIFTVQREAIFIPDHILVKG
jgi:hypothetical protein